MNQPKFSVKCVGQQLDVYETKVTISNVGFFQKVAHGGGSKTLQFRSISSIDFKPSGFTAGYIQFAASGTKENNGGIGDKLGDENTFVFKRGQNSVMEEIREFIQEKLDNPVTSPSSPSPSTNMSDELAKLASLHSQGILSDVEFEQAKSRILSGG